MKFDLSGLGARELAELILAAEKRKVALSRRRPAAVVRAALIEFIASSGYELNELISVQATAPVARSAKCRRKASKVAVKYRDPDNRRNTWTGRGSQPRWLRDKAKRGLSAADFLIDGLAKPTANTKSIGKRTVFKNP